MCSNILHSPKYANKITLGDELCQIMWTERNSLKNSISFLIIKEEIIQLQFYSAKMHVAGAKSFQFWYVVFILLGIQFLDYVHSDTEVPLTPTDEPGNTDFIMNSCI